jgi:hypothetical protein
LALRGFLARSTMGALATPGLAIMTVDPVYVPSARTM